MCALYTNHSPAYTGLWETYAHQPLMPEDMKASMMLRCMNR